MKLTDKFNKKNWFPYTVATCSAVLLYALISHFPDIFKGIAGFFAFLKPVITGIIIAYIFNPLAVWFENRCLKKVKNEKTRWTISVICSVVVIILFVTLLCLALIPQLADSIKTLFSNMDTYLDTLQGVLRQLEAGGAMGFLGINLGTLADLGDKIIDNISWYFSDNMGNFVNTTSTFGKSLLDLALGLILAIYFLMDKYKIVAKLSKLMSLLMKKENFEKTTEFLTRCNNIIIRYISVDLIDGVAVGGFNFLFMTIMKMPYAVLISVIVGVTNLAPTFGPLVGAVIGAFVLVLINPWQALCFLIFTVVLQTLDGYVLKPKLFGGSLGVSALMILISIILGGRLFGVGGILIAIPFAAILDFTWKDFVIKKLEERHAKRYNE